MFNTLDRTEMIEELANQGMPRYVAEQYCDLTLFKILKGEAKVQTVQTRPLSALYTANQENQKALAEKRKQEIKSYAHLGGMHRMAAAFENIDTSLQVQETKSC
ncbi:hypothetical protein [Shewanella livingstonensis]|uniref:Uncharacterized protein n=1 Tax=Shewanella livingstonensis TaxID=150120 RepID=A0A3G8LR56_9GAMM|nr:hypothetical protein [Shewanella livingstonensis]AZG71897.1 hypothetical protein EGC82_03435 [Shewanella livingstonensis]